MNAAAEVAPAGQQAVESGHSLMIVHGWMLRDLTAVFDDFPAITGYRRDRLLHWAARIAGLQPMPAIVVRAWLRALMSPVQDGEALTEHAQRFVMPRTIDGKRQPPLPDDIVRVHLEAAAGDAGVALLAFRAAYPLDDLTRDTADPAVDRDALRTILALNAQV